MASIKEKENNSKKVKTVDKVVGRCLSKGVILDLIVAEACGR